MGSLSVHLTDFSSTAALRATALDGGRTAAQSRIPGDGGAPAQHGQGTAVGRRLSCSGLLAGESSQSLSNHVSYRDDEVVVVLADEPREVLGDEVVLKGVATSDHELRDASGRLIDEEGLMWSSLNDKPEPLIRIRYDSSKMVEAPSILRMPSRRWSAEPFPPPTPDLAARKPTQERLNEILSFAHWYFKNFARSKLQRTYSFSDLVPYRHASTTS